MKNSFELSRSNIAPANITVNVIGEVKNPKVHDSINSTMCQAIFAAGGLIEEKTKKLN